MTTGIPFEVWRDGDQRALFTALDLMKPDPKSKEDDGRQMSG